MCASDIDIRLNALLFRRSQVHSQFSAVTDCFLIASTWGSLQSFSENLAPYRLWKTLDEPAPCTRCAYDSCTIIWQVPVRHLHIPHAAGVDLPRGQSLSLPREKGASYKGKGSWNMRICVNVLVHSGWNYFQKISFIRNTTQSYFLAMLRHILEKKLSYLAEKEIIIFGQRGF